MNCLMFYQGALVIKAFIAAATSVRLFGRMSSTVNYEDASVDKTLITYVTFIRFFSSCVSPMMGYQTAFTSKALIAQIAFVRLFSRYNFRVDGTFVFARL